MNNLRRTRKRKALPEVSEVLVPRRMGLLVTQLQTTPFSIPSAWRSLQNTTRSFPLMAIQRHLQIPCQHAIHSFARQATIQLRMHYVLDDVLKLHSTAIQGTVRMLSIIDQGMEGPYREGIWSRQHPILPLQCQTLIGAGRGRKPLPLVIATPSNMVTVYADLGHLKNRDRVCMATRF
jgi:hypothetical protein